MSVATFLLLCTTKGRSWNSTASQCIWYDGRYQIHYKAIERNTTSNRVSPRVDCTLTSSLNNLVSIPYLTVSQMIQHFGSTSLLVNCEIIAMFIPCTLSKVHLAKQCVHVYCEATGLYLVFVKYRSSFKTMVMCNISVLISHE